MSLAGIGQRWAEDAVLLRQKPGSPNEYGEWVEPEPERIPIRPITAPPSMATMRDVLPEGTRLEDARTVLGGGCGGGAHAAGCPGHDCRRD